MTVLNFT